MTWLLSRYSDAACSREGISEGEGAGCVVEGSREVDRSVPVSDHPETSGKVPGGLRPGLRAGPGVGAREGAVDRDGVAMSLRIELGTSTDVERDWLNKRTLGRSFFIRMRGTVRLT